MKKPGRNDPCPCGSGKKYKQCCGQLTDVATVMPHSIDASISQAIRAALEYHKAGQFAQADAVYRQILKAVPDQPDALHYLGLIAHKTGKNEIAVQLISRAIGIDPSSAKFCNLGLALNAQGKAAEAVASYQKALSMDPACAEAYNNLGVVRQEQGKLEEAIANYREALSLKADYVEAHNNLGFALKAQGKLDSAVASYCKALYFKPDYVEAHNNLGVALREQGKLDAAAASHQTAISIRPDCPEAHNSMGVVLEKQGRLEEAITSFRRAIAIKPDYPEAMNNLGIALQAQSKPDEAAATYHQALSLRGDISETQYNLGVVFQGQGKLDEAIDCFQKALEAAPAFAAAHIKLAMVLVTQGKLPEAYLHYRKALESSPTQVVANIELCKLLDRLVPPWHVPMMNDTMRNEAYIAAMKGAIKSDSDVLEIGTGSGLLAMLAARLGAKKVTTCEAEPLIAATAQKIIADNQLDETIKVISKKSLDVSVGVDLDNAADILVTEIFSNELLAENCLPSIEDAKRRLLKPGARVIPAGGSIMVALFGGGDLGANFNVGSCCGFDVRRFNSIISRKQIVARNDLDIEVFTDDIEAFRFDFESGRHFPEETKTLRMKINASGVCHGVIQWIRLKMDNETTFENHPLVKSSASGWQYCVYVFPEPLEVARNQVVLISAVHNRFYPWFSFDGFAAPVDQDVA